MATTTNLALRYPISTDPATIADYFANLADDVEARIAGVQSFAGSGAIAAAGARRVAVNAATPTLTLPAAVAGQEFEITNLHASSPATVARAGTDTLTPPTNANTVTSFTLPAGGRVRLTCAVAGTWQIAPEGSPALVSTLPAAPYDGMEVAYQTAAMATLGLAWRLRYNAASAHARKWEMQGGAPWVVEGGDITTASAVWTPFTGGPTLAVPAEGDYALTFGAYMKLTSAGYDIYGQVSLRTTAGIPVALTPGSPARALNAEQDVARSTKLSIAAGATLAMDVAVQGGIALQFKAGYISLVPIRL